MYELLLILAAVVPAAFLLIRVYQADKLEKEPAGLLISILICINAGKMICDAVTALLNIVPKSKRDLLYEMLSDSPLFSSVPDVRFDIDEENDVTATVALPQCASKQALFAEECVRLTEQCLQQTGIKLRFVLYV